MLDTSALSPEVKKLFADIAKHADLYKKAFSKIDSALDQFETERNNHNQELAQIQDDISNSIDKLEKYANDSIEEFKEKTEKTHSLYLELDKIDRLKTDLFDLKEEIKSQTIDLSSSLIDFNAKADKLLERTISSIKTTLTHTIDEEVSKMESRVIRRLVAFEKNQKIFDKRIQNFDANSKAEIKKLSGEVDYAYSSITELKSDLQNYFKQIIDKINYFDSEIPRISKLLDNTVNNSSNNPFKNSELQDNYSKKMDDDSNYDDSLFNFEDTTFGEDENDNSQAASSNSKLSNQQIIEKLQVEYEEFDRTVQDYKGRGLFSMILSIISLIGVLIVIVLIS